jgi:hypothetical protein
MTEEANNPRIAWGELEWSQGYGELLRGTGTQLREEKCHGGAWPIGFFTVHKNSITRDNHYIF